MLSRSTVISLINDIKQMCLQVSLQRTFTLPNLFIWPMRRNRSVLVLLFSYCHVVVVVVSFISNVGLQNKTSKAWHRNIVADFDVCTFLKTSKC